MPECTVHLSLGVKNLFADMERLGFVRVVGKSLRYSSRNIESEFCQRDANAVDDDATNHKKPNYNVHDFHEVFGIRPDLAVDGDLSEKLLADIEIKYGRDTNGPEEPNIEGLSRLLNLVYLRVHGEDDGGATKQEY